MRNAMKTIIMTATLAVLANVSYAVDNSAFDQLKNNVPNIELPNAPIPNIKVFEAPAAHRSNSFDQTAFLYDLAHALGETSVVRAPWAIDDISQPQGRILTAKQAQQLADRLSADRKIPFKAEGFLMSFSLPNFYFHATTAYDILRQKGVPLGKRDFLGRLRIAG